MKGRKGMELRGTKIALAAVLTCLLSLTAWLGVSQLTARADGDASTASANAAYNASTDTLTVRDGSVAYEFFTVANASKSIPAANQWVSTKNGTIGLSGKSGASIYYFSHTTSPEKGDVVAVVVPATSTIKKVKYDKTTQLFTVEAKHSYFDPTGWKSKVDKTTSPALEYSVGNTDKWKDMTASSTSYAISDEDLDVLEKTGGVVNVRVKGASGGAVEAANVAIPAGKVKKAGVVGTVLDFGNKQNTEVSLRNGASKQVKVAKIAVGPAVTIDYANHAIKLKKDTAYRKMNNKLDEPSDASSNALTQVSQTTPIYSNSVKDQYFVVCKYKTKRLSSYTHVMIKAEKSMADAASADAFISGLFGNDATLVITQPKNDDAKTAYQYALGKENLLSSGNANVEVFDYATSADKSKQGKLAWKGVNVNKGTADGAKVKLTWKSIKEYSYVYVRKAAVAKNGEFSSQVIRFTIPKTENATWVKHIQGSSDVAMPTATIKYIANGVFGINAVVGSVNFTKGKVTINKKDYAVKTVDESTIKKALSSASADASANAYFIVGATDLKQKTNLSVGATICAGTIESNGIANVDYAASTTANTFKPSISKVTGSSGSVVFTFNTSLDDSATHTTVSGVTGKKVLHDASGNAQTAVAIESADYTVSGKTITFNKSLKTDDTFKIEGLIFKNDYGINSVTYSSKNEGKAK